MKRAARIIAPAQYVLPASFSREIGRIMVHWAYFEHVIRHIAWDIIGVDHSMGRIAIRDPRIDDHLDMLVDIAYLKKLSLDATRIGTLKKKASGVQRWRDVLGHGVWLPRGDRWLLQMTSGQYPKNLEAEHRKRRVNPRGN
jgi:hypothetical protein